MQARVLEEAEDLASRPTFPYTITLNSELEALHCSGIVTFPTPLWLRDVYITPQLIFRLKIPPNYPRSPPMLIPLKEIWHPLVPAQVDIDVELEELRQSRKMEGDHEDHPEDEDLRNCWTYLINGRKKDRWQDLYFIRDVVDQWYTWFLKPLTCPLSLNSHAYGALQSGAPFQLKAFIKAARKAAFEGSDSKQLDLSQEEMASVMKSVSRRWGKNVSILNAQKALEEMEKEVTRLKRECEEEQRSRLAQASTEEEKVACKAREWVDGTFIVEQAGTGIKTRINNLNSDDPLLAVKVALVKKSRR